MLFGEEDRDNNLGFHLSEFLKYEQKRKYFKARLKHIDLGAGAEQEQHQTRKGFLSRQH